MTREQLAPAGPGDDWEDVEGQWLAAGRINDVLRMQELQHRHPQRLALNRVVGSTAEGTDARQQSRVSDWSGFPLETLGDSAIHAAAWNCSIGVIRFLLESGQHPDTRDDWQLTPLMVITMRHGLPLIRSVFVDREAIPRHLVMDVREENDERTAVALEIVQLLLLHGADIDARNDDGKTALIVAAHDNTFEIAEMLLDRGASLDLRDQRGWTALRHSIEARGLFTTNLLIARGADIDLPDTNGISPLRAAIQKQFINQLQLFINHYALSVRESRLDFVGYILLEAVAANSFEVVKWLLREDTFVTIQFQNELGETAFHHVRSSRMVKLLLEFDLDASVFHTRTLKRESCFHFAACKSGDPSKCTLSAMLDVLDSGHSHTVEADEGVSDLLGGDAGGETPLFEAATNLNDSLEVRAAKCSALESHNAPLFPSGYQLWRVKDSGGKNSDALVIISDRVQLCLRCWLLQTHNTESDSSEAAREVEALVTRWIALVDFAHGQREDKSPPLSGEVMLLLVFTGHTHDLLSLVLSLPLHQTTASMLLGLLTRFADSRRLRQDHTAFLQRLVMEMTAALELPSSAYPEL